jgi:spore coat protein A, manganese oxidase
VARYRQVLMAVCSLGGSSNAVAALAKLLNRRRRATSLSILSLALMLFVNIERAHASSLVPQTQLDGNCFPKFTVALPVFGPAGSISRVDTVAHPYISVTMKEIDQTVLPQGFYAPCGVTLGTTRVWAFETTDTNTGQVLGPASWPADTLVTQKGTPTQVEYVNQLPSFNPQDPTGPGLVQGLLETDQTLHWADPLQTGCGMQHVQCGPVKGTWSADRPVLFEDTEMDYCGHKKVRQAGEILPASYNINTYADSSSPCCQQYIGPIPATVHLHGGEIPAYYDGNPNSWFTPNGLTGPDYHTIGNPGPGKAIYEYQNSQDAGSLWFHDHALGTTRLNVYAGLAGFYLARDPNTQPAGLPTGAYEEELVFQDRLFDTNSQLYFPDEIQLVDHPFWSVLFEGDVATVNGAAFPYTNVEPRRYHFHLLNGDEHRSYVLHFGNAPIYQVGADDAYFDQPVSITSVALDPGQRADIIVDFTKSAGQNIIGSNTGINERYFLPELMQFRVASAAKNPDLSCDPANHGCQRPNGLVHLTDGQGHVLPGVKIDRVRQLVLNEDFDPPIDIEEILENSKWNGLESPNIAIEFPTDGISELPRVGSIELWEIANIYYPGTDLQTHPFHIHLSEFQVLNRQNLQVDGPSGYYAAWNQAFGSGPAPLPSGCTPGQVCLNYGPPLSYNGPNADGALGGNPAFGPYLTGDVIAPEAGEAGWNDTAVAHQQQVLRILVRWTPKDVPVIPGHSYAGQNLYPFDPTQGYYVWHCHLLTHEDNEMMRPYRVTN